MSTLRILLIGDIVARPGRNAVSATLPQLKKEEKIDLVIANAENLSGGRGVTRNALVEMMDVGVDYFTSGNHVFSLDGWGEILEDKDLRIIRPMNYVPDNLPGSGFKQFEVHGQTVVLVNLEGSENIGVPVKNPFVSVDKFISNLKLDDPIILVDFHAELTSEKRAFGFFLDGRVTAVWGTHTHVPTADLQALPNGTVYVTDLGMVGARDSVLGVEKDVIIRRFIEPARERFTWEYQGPMVFNSVLIEVDSDGSVTQFSRVDRIIP